MKQAAIRYSYFDHSPSTWLRDLERFRSRGIERIQIYVPWSVHEAQQGAVDISRHPRLRLEKFFSYVGQSDLKLDLVVGFCGGAPVLPEWVFRAYPKGSLVSRGSVTAEKSTLDTIQLPSIVQPGLLQSFCRFLEHLYPLFALHQTPHGPIRRISFDLGVYSGDLFAHLHRAFVHSLERRYGGDIALLNLAYQTHFPNFETAIHRQGLRTLLQKRPWLFAFDYKWCRQQLTQPVYMMVFDALGLDPSEGSGGDANFTSVPSSDSWSVVADPIPVELDGANGEPYPFLPEGLVSSDSIAAYRVVGFFQQQTQAASIPWTWFRNEGGTLYPSRNRIVLSGKYLSSPHSEMLRQTHRRGGIVYFPLGLAQYDENLKRIVWSDSDRSRDIESPNGSKFRVLSIGSGYLVVPTENRSFADLTRSLKEMSFLENALAPVAAKIDQEVSNGQPTHPD